MYMKANFTIDQKSKTVDVTVNDNYDDLPTFIGKNLSHKMVILKWYVYRISLIFDG